MISSRQAVIAREAELWLLAPMLRDRSRSLWKNSDRVFPNCRLPFVLPPSIRRYSDQSGKGSRISLRWYNADLESRRVAGVSRSVFAYRRCAGGRWLGCCLPDLWVCSATVSLMPANLVMTVAATTTHRAC